jgi:hypothetical protein
MALMALADATWTSMGITPPGLKTAPSDGLIMETSPEDWLRAELG